MVVNSLHGDSITGTALIEKVIRDVPDFPRKGILFKDITPVLRNPETLILTSRMLLEPCRPLRADIVVGIESRGFFFGPEMAANLAAGFVPVRKPDKLPADTRSATYDLEYGTDSLEIHSDAVRPGERVIIHDDLLATGGSAGAATRLVEELGGEVVAYSFILELVFLDGKSRLNEGIPIYSLIKA